MFNSSSQANTHWTAPNTAKSARPSTVRRGVRAPSATPAPAHQPKPNASSSLNRSSSRNLRRSSSYGGLKGQEREREEEKSVWVRDECYCVWEVGKIPLEVQRMVERSDLYQVVYKGGVEAGWAYLIAKEGVWVWNTSQHAGITLYVFPAPPSQPSPYPHLPLLTLLPLSRTIPPSLLLFSPTTGDLHFYSTLTHALTSTPPTILSVPIRSTEGEVLKGITRLDELSWVISTSHSRLFRLDLTFGMAHGHGDRFDLQIRELRGVSSGMFGAVLSGLFGRGSDPRGGVRAVAVDKEEGKMVVVNEAYLEAWKVGKEGAREKVETGHSVRKSVAEFLQRNAGVTEEEALGAQVVDIAFTKDNSKKQLVMLVEYKQSQNTNLLSYTLLLTKLPGNSNEPLHIDRLILLSHRASAVTSFSPKLHICSQAAILVFSTTVLLVSIAAGADYEEVIPLRNPQRGILGSSGINEKDGGYEMEIMTAENGIMGVKMEEKAVWGGRKVGKMRAMLEHAVFYGDRPENPIDFSLHSNFGDDVETPARALSAEVLMNTSPKLSKTLDMRLQLSDRIQKLENLIHYILSNGLLSKLSQNTRRILCSNQEKLIAAQALWERQNERLIANEAETTVFDEVVYIHLSRMNAVEEETMRPFLRDHVQEIGSALEKVGEVLRMRMADGMEEKVLTIHEANFVVLTAYNHVLEQRPALYQQYAIDTTSSSVEPWSSAGSLIDVMKQLFEMTDHALTDHQREFGAQPLSSKNKKKDNLQAGQTFEQIRADPTLFQEHVKKQMSELVNVYCATCEERLVYLRTLETVEAPIMAKALSDRYLGTRPLMLKALIRISSFDDAFELAQRYYDFRILVELCTSPHYGSNDKIDDMIHKFQEDFAFQLYQYYIETGRVRSLLEQEEQYHDILLKFLESTDNPKLGWIHEILLSRHNHAYNQLVREAKQEKNVDEHKLMLSIAKLCKVAELSTPDFETKEIEIVDQLLDVMESHEHIRDIIRKVADQQEESVQEEPEDIKLTILNVLGARITEYEAYPSVFRQILSEVMQHHVVSGEDIIDVFTLMQPPDDDLDFCHAIGLLEKIQSDLPRARADFALKTIWRRLYLAGDVWPSLRNRAISDDHIETILRATPLAITLRQLEDAGFDNRLRLSPTECLFEISERKVVEARFSHFPSDALNALIEDYARESEILQGELDEGLESYVEEIHRLLAVESVSSTM